MAVKESMDAVNMVKVNELELKDLNDFNEDFNKDIYKIRM